MNFREKFQAWHKARFGYVTEPIKPFTAMNCKYQEGRQQARWEGWQASTLPEGMVVVPNSIHPLENSEGEAVMALLKNPPSAKDSPDQTEYYAKWWEMLVRAALK